MQIVERVAWSELGWAGGVGPPAHAAASDAPMLTALEQVASRPAMSAALAHDLAREDPAQATAWDRLAAAGARVVISGQQPGAAGGTLLVFYKAATAVALAHLAAQRLRCPVVPVFWNAADDVDFDEVARVAWPTRDDLLFFEMSAQHRRAESFVGDLPASEDDALARAMLQLVPADRLDVLPAQARDHGDWVGTLLRRVFPELVVLDGRSPALRRHAAPLFAAYLQQHEGVRAAVESAGRGVEDLGLQRAISPASARQALFLIRDGQRIKSRNGVAELEAALRSAPETLSPNVVLRPLVQDLLLPVIAQVAGPAEMAYLHELRPLRALLGVPTPAIVPRVSLTVLDSATWDSLARLGLGTADVLRSPRNAVRAHARQQVRAPQQRIAEAAERFGADLNALGGALSAKAQERAAKRLAGVQDELAGDLEDTAVRRLLADEPALQRLDSLVRPRDRWQERVVAALWLLAQRGDRMSRDLVTLSQAHLERAARGELEHLVVVA